MNTKNICTKLNDKITLVRGKYFPYLDVAMYWNLNNELRFKIHMKENQKLKYLNKGSCHTSKCFEAIPNGVFKRLFKLTSRGNKMLNSRVYKIYPEHAKALQIANLVPDKFPKMKKILEVITISNEKKTKENENLKKRKMFRQTYFCIGICDVWKRKNAIHITLKSYVKSIILNG